MVMRNTYFEGREVKPYGDYVRGADLVAGRVYFKVGYLDDDMVVPELSAMVFLGKDLNPRLPGLYFQDAASYFGGERFDPEASVPPDTQPDDADGYTWVGEDVLFEWQRDRKYSGVFEFDGALDSLLGCSLRRQEWDGVVRLADPPEES